LPGNLFLAPVAGYTNRAFRSVCTELGADFSYTELASSEAIARNGLATLGLIRRADNEKHYGIQLFGANPEIIYTAVSRLKDFGPSLVDINCGCPVVKVVKTGAGSALMKDPILLGRIVLSAVKASEECLGGIPVTVKIRSGWDAKSVNFRDCAAAAVEAGAAMVCLHPRTKAQGYSGKSDWNHIAELASSFSVPVAGSGDLFSPEDAGRMFSETGCAALMFARGAVGNPFIFRITREYLKNGSWEEPSYKERFAAAFKQLELHASYIGEKQACREMRKVFAAYTKGMSGKPGLPGGARLRDRLVRAETIADYYTILENGMRLAES
jgi:nifR3 family TIM-barrel protein